MIPDHWAQLMSDCLPARFYIRPTFPGLRDNPYFDRLWDSCVEASLSVGGAMDEKTHFTYHQMSVVPGRDPDRGSEACAVFVACRGA